MIVCLLYRFYMFFVKQKTAYVLRISDWSSDVCSSELVDRVARDHRSGEGDLLEAEVGDRGAEGRLVDRHAHEQRQREEAVHDPGAELGALGEALVEVQRLRVHRHHRDQRVVALGASAGHGVADHRPGPTHLGPATPDATITASPPP